MTATTSERRSRLAGLASAASMVIFIAGLNLVLAWIQPFALVPPRVG